MKPNDAPIQDEELEEGAINSIFDVETEADKQFWEHEPKEEDDE